MSEDARSKARDYAVQFLYQCESEKIFYFSDPHFDAFVSNFKVPAESGQLLSSLVNGVYDHLDQLDSQISELSSKWPLARMPAMDRNVLRLAAYELLESKTPVKVVLNEAIELAKKYGTSESGSFVNGLLDRLAKTTR